MMLVTLLLGPLSLLFLGPCSYDLSYLVRPNVSITNLVVVYLDDRDLLEFGDGQTGIGRINHAKLLDHLAAAGARLVFYDVAFDTTNADPRVDETFARAISNQASTVLVAAVDPLRSEGARGEQPIPPANPFRHACKAFGH